MMRLVWRVCGVVVAAILALVPARSTAQEAGFSCDEAGVIVENGTYLFDSTASTSMNPCWPDYLDLRVVWYQFTAPYNGSVTANLCGSDFSTWLSVFDAGNCPTCENLVIEHEANCDTPIVFNVVAGRTYTLAASGYSNGDFGQGILNFEFTPAVGSEYCDDSTEISSNGLYYFDTTNSDGEVPCWAGWELQPVWYQYTATESGYLRACIYDANFPTWLSVYRGEGCPTCDDILAEGGAGCENGVVVPVFEGRTYKIVVSGFDNGDAGQGALRFEFFKSVAGEQCSASGYIDFDGVYFFDTSTSTAPHPCRGLPDAMAVWHEVLFSETRIVTLRVCDATAPVMVSVYEGYGCPECDDLVMEGIVDCDTPLQFLAFEHLDYSIVISELTPGNASQGYLSLESRMAETEFTCSMAPSLKGNGRHYFDNTNSVSLNPCWGTYDLRPVWYRYIPSQDGIISANMCGSSFDTWLSIFESLLCRDCDDLLEESTAVCGGESVSFNVAGGYPLWIAAGGFDGQDYGAGVLNFAFIPNTAENGDVNGDGIVNVADVTEFANIMQLGVDLPVSLLDYNLDEVVDEHDLQELAMWIVD
jgi:hypothetical protein